MNIEKLCEEFHEKIGRDKKLKISILEGDTETEDTEGWFIGKADRFKVKNIKRQRPFAKLTKGLGIEYSYITL